ncbi:UMP kinase [Candidatus Woesearchaeota archaeon]|nr:UMP kinase [Candidatus Woesearchaeota archaeon]
MVKKKVIIISVGGSVIVPDDIDVGFLKELNKLVRDYKDKYKFILITGGGSTAREYQKAADSVAELDAEDLDWLGIHATRLNAHLLRTIFKDIAYSRFIKNPGKKVKFDNVLIAAGWKPGFSTDYDAVKLAETYNSETVVNMTNIEYLYEKDPTIYKNAKKIEKTDWEGLKSIVGEKWVPGMNTPFDPEAVKKGVKLGLKLVLVGNNLHNFRKFLDGKKFKGSIVE